jgi:hypothetical protein
MINSRAEIKDSWVRSAPSTRDLAAFLGMATPVTLRDIVTRLHQVETVHVDKAIHTPDSTPITGHVTLDLHSDGSYVFTGFMEATGIPSYHYGVQAWASGSDGVVVAAQQTGNVYGMDTPGDERQNWSQPGNNPGITQHWRALRGGAGIGYHLEAEITGVLGAGVDVLKFAVKGLVANLVLGPYGWTLLIGNELAGMDAQINSPDILAGIVVAGGVFLIVGPFGLVPALIAGVATASLLDVRHRSLHPWERTFADQVFGAGTIDYNRIIVTNLSKSGGTKFTMPSIGNTILLNMGAAAFDDPMSYTQDGNYPIKGEVFIHELTHAWQICRKSIVDVICGLSDTYTYYTGTSRSADRSWQGRAWNGFNNEQQATIVNEWYRIYSSDLNSFAALNDPAFRFIRDNIRAGVN